MTVRAGDEIPSLEVEVDPQRMKTMVALIQDPYPIHYDPASVAELGLGERVINQAPLSVGYLANMLMAWQGDDCVRRLTTSMKAPVFGGDRVVAGGVVSAIIEVDGERRARCDVWLDTDAARAVVGTAVIAVKQ